MMGWMCCHLAISSGVGILPVFLSGWGAPSVLKMAYLVPRGKLTFFRKRCIEPIGLPTRPGEPKTYRSAGGSSLGVASRMWCTLTSWPRAPICLFNSSATLAPLPYLEA